MDQNLAMGCTGFPRSGVCQHSRIRTTACHQAMPCLMNTNTALAHSQLRVSLQHRKEYWTHIELKNIRTMSNLNVSSDETRAEHHTRDLERGSDETIKHSTPQVAPNVDTERGYHATDIYKSMHLSLFFTPWIVGMVLREKLKWPSTSSSPSQRGHTANSVAGALLAIILGATFEAPVAAGMACLENLIGSWLMRMHHSHHDCAFHAGSTQGNYALAGALSAFPAMAIIVMARPSLMSRDSGVRTFSLTYLVLHLALSAAVGAAAAAIGGARGFEIQTVANSTLANVAGMGFIFMVLFPISLNLWLWMSFFKSMFSGR